MMDPVTANRIRSMHSPTMRMCAVVVTEKCVFDFKTSFFGRHLMVLQPLNSRIVRNAPLLAVVVKITQVTIFVVWNSLLGLGAAATFTFVGCLRPCTFHSLRLVDLCGHSLEPLIMRIIAYVGSVTAKLYKTKPKPVEMVEVVKPKPVEEVKAPETTSKECGICLEEVAEGQNSEHRCSETANRIHKKCMDEWLEKQLKTNPKGTCPLCVMEISAGNVSVSPKETKALQQIFVDSVYAGKENSDYIYPEAFTAELTKNNIKFTERMIAGLKVLTISENETANPIKLYLKNSTIENGDDDIVINDVVFSEVDIAKLKAEAEEMARRDRIRRQDERLREGIQRPAAQPARFGWFNALSQRFRAAR